MGLLANWEYQREESKPQYTERGSEYRGIEGLSESKFIVFTPVGAGGYTTFYTVPAGRVFLLKEVQTKATSGLRINGTEIMNGEEQVTFDQPIRYAAGTTFASNLGSAVTDFTKLIGIEETEEINRERNVI